MARASTPAIAFKLDTDLPASASLRFRKNICRRLAQRLAAHGTELEQILVASGKRGFDRADVKFIDRLSERVFLEMVKDVHGEAHVLAAIEQCERNLKDKYSKMLEGIPEPEAATVLQRHRDGAEFGEHVLRTMRDATDRQV